MDRCPVSDPQTTIRSAPARAEGEGQHAPVGVSQFGRPTWPRSSLCTRNELRHILVFFIERWGALRYLFPKNHQSECSRRAGVLADQGATFGTRSTLNPQNWSMEAGPFDGCLA